MTRTPKRDQPKATARRELHRELEAARAGLTGEAPRPTVGTPSRGDRRATLRERLPRAGLADLAEQGVEVGDHGAVTLGGKPVAQVREAWPGADAPFRVQSLVGLALDKPRAIRSPTWLALVRAMPCSFCSAGRPFLVQISMGRAQSEAHHVPGRGRGGSDLETCPACRACHERCTRHEISEAEQEVAVRRTGHAILAAIRRGEVPPGFLLAVAIEVVIS